MYDGKEKAAISCLLYGLFNCTGRMFLHTAFFILWFGLSGGPRIFHIRKSCALRKMRLRILEHICTDYTSFCFWRARISKSS